MPRRLAALLLGAALAACAPTELVLVVDTNLTIPDELDQVRVTVLDADANVLSDTTHALTGAGAVSLPGTLVLHPIADASHVVVRVVGLHAGATVLERDVQTTFVPHASRELDVALLASCVGVACATTGQTCTYGGCDDGTVDAQDLAPWTGTPSPIAPGPILQLSALAAHTCAVRARGDVVCWGDDHEGQLGDGTLGDANGLRTRPVVVRGVADAVEVAAGRSFTCARRRGGAVTCWGDNHGGELGDGVANHHGMTCENGSASPGDCVPTAGSVVANLADAATILAGSHSACVRRAGGALACWGQNNDANIDGLPSMTGFIFGVPQASTNAPRVDLVALGAWHVCARSPAAASPIACWGNNDHGQLGGAPSPPPIATGGDPTPVPQQGLSDAVALSAGGLRSCAITGEGNLWCWGDNTGGDLGASCGASCAGPVQVAGVAGVAQVALSGAEFSPGHVCALGTDGSVSCWGDNDHGQLGQGDTTRRAQPTRVDAVHDVVAVVAGDAHTCALERDHSLWCWGEADETGQGAADDATTPVRIAP